MFEPSAPPSIPLSSPDDLFQTLFEVSLSGVLLLRPLYGPDNEVADFALDYLNPAGQRILGLPERPEGTLLTRFPHTVAAGTWAFYLRVFETGQVEEFDINYQADGFDNYFRHVARRSGERLVVSFTDTADQERSAVEVALRESQARERAALAEAELQRQQLHNSFMQAPAAIASLSGPAHTFMLANPSYQQLFGDRPLVGKPIREALPELEGQPFFGMLDEVYRTGETFYGSEVLAQLDRTNSGRLEAVYFNFIYQATRDAAGAVVGVLIFAYDVTEQVQARHQVQNLNEELAAANEELQAANEEFLVNNAELTHAQRLLRQLNEELEARVVQRTQAVQRAQAESEEQRGRLERLFMQAPAAICILSGPDLVYELVNPGYQQLFPGRALLGKAVLAALPEIANHAVYATFRRVYETGVTHEEHSILVPIARPEDGVLEDRYFNYVQQARYDEYGRVDGVLVFAFEITQQVQAQQQVERSEARFRRLAETAPMIVWEADAQGDTTYLSPHWEEFAAAANGHGLSWQDYIHPDDQELFIQNWLTSVRTQQPFQAEVRLRVAATDEYRWYLDRAVPVRDAAGAVVQWVGAATDIHEQKQTAKALQRLTHKLSKARDEAQSLNAELSAANQQLTRTNVDLDNFIYTASHDLKAPITNIEGLLHALQQQLPAGSQDDDVSLILSLMQGAVDRFKTTIDHLTEVSKLQKEHDQPAIAVNLAEVIEGVRLDLLPLIEQAEVRLEVDVAACPTLSFSKKNLRSIVYNLLSNACKYRHPDRPAQVAIHCRVEDHYMVLEVRDNGLGLDLTRERQLFSMFQRYHTHVEGSGIGLYMVKKMMENAGGKIEVKSQLGVGSTFRVYFKH